MKIKRFTAADMRQAMCLVRDEQGPDAVILSTRRIADGIEVIAAMDYDESLVSDAVRQQAEPVSAPARVVAPGVASLAGSRPVARAPSPLRRPVRNIGARPAALPARIQDSPTSPAREASMEHAAAETAHMREELSSMRAMLETQLSSLAWNDMERRQPLQACVLREMTK
ncbi:MAG TPA: flagellar biosynthesis protein FlhF, partial [Rhodanobacter sp.]|nr:flagellar biosynthesis protein FlhF [Rhodanobacter sp.]